MTLYFLDFETIGPAVPKYNGSRPYQQLVFQYSLHVQETSTSEIEHRDYLADPSQDPKIGFIEQLIEDCGTSGDIIVYNIGFERGKLNDLIDVFPEYSNELRRIVNRLKDLMIPFQQKWYYTPEMRGSYSIKYVLPALVPELSYNDLDIKEGGAASIGIRRMERPNKRFLVASLLKNSKILISRVATTFSLRLKNIFKKMSEIWKLTQDII